MVKIRAASTSVIVSLLLFIQPQAVSRLRSASLGQREWMSAFAAPPPRPRPKILILGGGIGGVSTAFDMSKEFHDAKISADITVISPNEEFEFVPSNPGIFLRQIDPRDTHIDLQEILEKKGIEYKQDKMTHVNPDIQTIELKSGEILPYDYLVLATGPKLSSAGVPGYRDHILSVCTSKHALEGAKKWEEYVKDPISKGPVVVGALQGASCFGPAVEMALMMETDLRQRQIRHKVPMYYLTPEPYVGHLGLKGVGVSRDLLESVLRERSIEWRVNCEILEVGEKEIRIRHRLKEDGDPIEETIPYGLSVMIPQFDGPGVASSNDQLFGPHGMVKINKKCQNDAYPNIFGVGVCVHIPPVDRDCPVPCGAPKTGYMIETMGTAVASNVASMIQGEKPSSIPSLGALCLTDFGDDGAVFMAVPQMAPRNINWFFRGVPAKLAKMAFEKYFMFKLRTGDTDPYYEKYMLHLIGLNRLDDFNSLPTSTKEADQEEELRIRLKQKN